MTRALLLMSLVFTMLTGCVSETVKSTSVPVLDAPEALTPEAELLDVGVVILNPGISRLKTRSRSTLRYAKPKPPLWRRSCLGY